MKEKLNISKNSKKQNDEVKITKKIKSQNNKNKLIKKEKEINNKEKIEKKEIKSKLNKKTENKVNKNEDYKDYEKVLEKSNKRKKKIMTIIGIVIGIILLCIFCIIFSLINMGNTKIYSNITIQGIDVSGMTQEEAKQALEELFENKSQHDILLTYQEYETNLNPKIIEITYDINKAVDEAYLVGRKGNIVSNNFSILGTLIRKKNIPVNVNINEEALKNIMTEISKNLPGTIIESGYYIEENNLIITKGKEGIIVNEQECINKIYEELQDIDNKKEFIEISVTNQKPQEVNLEKIKEEVYKEAQNAYFIKEPFEVHPEVNGIDFDLEKAKEILKEEKEEYIIPLIITKPEITLEKIGSEAFPDVLGSYTTRYDMSNEDRTTNLQLAVNKINGTILLANQEFSYNTTVGERTIAAGYREAKVYENGQVVDGLGGGICQISSTLYNAVVLANLEITQRRNHQFVTSYLPAGRDATVVYGSQDFKFKNTRKYPIKINASINNGVAKIEINGLKQENESEISFETHTISTIPFSVKYIDDNNLDEGQEKIEQKGVNGIVTETYKIERVNGNIVAKTLLSKDTYNCMQRVIKRGKRTVETSAEPVKEDNKEAKDKKQEKDAKDKTQKEDKKKEQKKKDNKNIV